MKKIYWTRANENRWLCSIDMPYSQITHGTILRIGNAFVANVLFGMDVKMKDLISYPIAAGSTFKEVESKANKAILHIEKFLFDTAKRNNCIGIVEKLTRNSQED